MEAKTVADRRHYDNYIVIIGNDVAGSKDEEVPEEVVEKLGRLEMKNRSDPNRFLQTPLGDSRFPLVVVDSDPH